MEPHRTIPNALSREGSGSRQRDLARDRRRGNRCMSIRQGGPCVATSWRGASAGDKRRAIRVHGPNTRNLTRRLERNLAGA